MPFALLLFYRVLGILLWVLVLLMLWEKYRIVRGGATFWVPAVERIDKLDMCLMQVDIKTAQPVPTKEYISVLVDAVANIKIGSDDLSIATAAEQLLHVQDYPDAPKD